MRKPTSRACTAAAVTTNRCGAILTALLLLCTVQGGLEEGHRRGG